MARRSRSGHEPDERSTLNRSRFVANAAAKGRMLAAVRMALESNESPWMEVYRAALRRRRPRLGAASRALADELREPLDTALVLGIVFAAAILLACAFPV